MSRYHTKSNLPITSGHQSVSPCLAAVVLQWEVKLQPTGSECVLHWFFFFWFSLFFLIAAKNSCFHETNKQTKCQKWSIKKYVIRYNLYFSSVSMFPLSLALTEELPYLKCPLHTVLKLTPVAYGRTCPEMHLVCRFDQDCVKITKGWS